MSFKDVVIDVLQKQTGVDKKQIEEAIEIPPDFKLGNYAFPCFILSKKLKNAPNVIAKELSSKIKPNNEIEKVEAVGPYINFFINRQEFAKQVINMDFEIDSKEIP